jgi:hypothetical protein
MSVLRILSGFGNFYLCLFMEPNSDFGVFVQISAFHHFIVGALNISPLYLTGNFVVCKSMIKTIEILFLLFWQMGKWTQLLWPLLLFCTQLNYTAQLACQS